MLLRQEGKHGMLAVVGLDDAALEGCIRDALRGRPEGCGRERRWAALCRRLRIQRLTRRPRQLCHHRAKTRQKCRNIRYPSLSFLSEPCASVPTCSSPKAEPSQARPARVWRSHLYSWASHPTSPSQTCAFNASTSTAGDKDALVALEPLLRARGASVVQTLTVSGAFHTHLMEPAAAALRDALAKVRRNSLAPSVSSTASSSDARLCLSARLLTAGRICARRWRSARPEYPSFPT